jgi:hypothetical protein
MLLSGRQAPRSLPDDRRRLVARLLTLQAQMEIAHAELAERVRHLKRRNSAPLIARPRMTDDERRCLVTPAGSRQGTALVERH